MAISRVNAVQQITKVNNKKKNKKRKGKKKCK
jgi:hypothetical protein